MKHRLRSLTSGKRRGAKRQSTSIQGSFSPCHYQRQHQDQRATERIEIEGRLGADQLVKKQVSHIAIENSSL